VKITETSVKFLPVPEFPDYYVGTNGSVWSYLNGRWGPGNKPHQLKPGLGRVGYLTVVLCRDGKHVTMNVHRLVLEAFVGPCPEGMEGCHNDGIRTNNRLENLRWDTPKNNQADRVKHGTDFRGERSPSAKLREEDVREIKRLLRQGWLHRKIARKYGVVQSLISGINTGKRWRYVS
jgi:hypothetical protein